MQRIVNGKFGDSFDTMTVKPYATTVIKVASVNKTVTIICHDTTTSKNLKLNLFLGLTFKLLE